MSRQETPASPTARRRADVPVLLRAIPQEVWVELTSRCNARCIYCCVSQPGYHGEDLRLEPRELADMLAPFHPPEVRISGHGETTMLPNWAETARHLLARGFAVTTNSNFARAFSDDEIDVLSRFRSLEVSCDTTDPELHERVRRGVRLERIETNIGRIRALCEREFREVPFLNISCTLTDLTMHGLPDLVRWAARHGANRVEVVNLERYPALPGVPEWRNPSETDPAGTLELLDEARGIAHELGLTFRAQEGLVEACQAAFERSTEGPGDRAR